MNWFAHHAFPSRTAEWLALAVVILLSLAFCIGVMKFVSSLLTGEHDTDKPENDYWHIHEGK